MGTKWSRESQHGAAGGGLRRLRRPARRLIARGLSRPRWRRPTPVPGRRPRCIRLGRQLLEPQAVDLLLEVPRREVPVNLGRDPGILMPHDPLDRRQVGAQRLRDCRFLHNVAEEVA
jgi:hypothetical protein